MKNRQTIQYAVMCLQELDQHNAQVVSSYDISKRQGIPLADCETVLEQLSQAGLIEAADSNQYVLRTPLENLKALEILQALSTPVRVQPEFQILYAAQKVALGKTLETLRWSRQLDVFPSDGIVARG